MGSAATDKLLPESGKEEEEEEEKQLGKRLWVESKKLWIVAGPATLTRASMFGVFIISQAFTGHLGNTEMAALSVVFQLLTRFSIGILMGMSSGLETLCGQAYGAKQYHMLGIYLQRSWLVETAVFLLLIPIFIFSAPIFRLLGQTEEISLMANVISLWYIPIIFSYVFLYTLQMYLQTQSKNMIITWLSAVTLILHGFCSWILVDKLGLGIPGVMISMNIASWVPIVGQLIFVFYGGCPQTWTGFSLHAFAELWPVFKLSISSGVMLCLELWYNSMLILFTGHTQDAQIIIDALSICLNINGWELMFSFGFLAAASVRVSNELGRGSAKAAIFAIKVVVATSITVEAVLWILVLAFRHIVSYIFSSSVEVADEFSDLSLLLAFTLILNSIQPVLSGVAVGAGWQVIVAYVNIICYYCIGLPIGLLLYYVGHLDVKGIWIGMIIGTFIQTFVLLYYVYKTDWDKQVAIAKERVNRWVLPAPDEKENDSSI
ncbi:protein DETOXIFICATION 20-like [Macadamia integrifolia]|uniref:protein DETOXIFICATION 20-like n=1 Tax=Macadamia integrifolia TaxID=60698 RepID=UPI001C4FE087|nr:protein DETOXIFICATION 20-like [Macadamia integrifolia]